MQEEKEEIIATEEGEDDDDDGPPPGFQCIIAPPPPEAGKAEPEDDKEEEEMEKEKEREKEEEEVEVEEDEEDDGPPPGFDCISLKPPPPIPISDIATNIKQEDTEDDEDGPPPGWEFTNLANALPKPPSAETDIKTESNEELDLDDDDGPPPGWETVLPHQMPPPQTPPLQASPTVSTNTDNIDIEMESQQKIAENDDEEPPSVSPCNPMPMHSSPPTPPLHQPLSELPTETGSKEEEKKVEEKKPTTQQQLPPTPWPLTPVPAPSSSEKAQLVCGTCRKLCVYPRGSKWVQCPGCQEVNFVLEAHEVGQVKCGGCSVLLMFPHGGQKVQCSSCRFITEIGVKRFKPGKKSAITHMAFEQYIMQEWKSIPTYSENTSACFDCNICLEFARDPVVTLCGHLYCWPCIYKWFDSQTASLPPGQLPQCPVCKAETSEKTVVPLYGRGQSIYEPEHETNTVPPRPPASRITDLINPEGQLGNLANPYRDNEESLEPSLLNLRGLAPMALSHPVALMLGEMVYTRVFGNSASLYAYPNSHHSAGSSTPIGRRRELEADKSLSRVSIFLFCCFLLCLLLF